MVLRENKSHTSTTCITSNKLARSEEHSSSHTNRPQNCASYSVITGIIILTIDLVRQNSGFQHFSPHL